MNRPRNRQPRPQRQQDTRPNQNRPTNSSNRNFAPPTRAQASGTVPTIAFVVPGADVWIVLKEDQPTGDETRGVVQDVLTRGNHPRGIKVRLTDGQVGRVQRMGSGGGTGQQQGGGDTRFTRRYTDVRNDEYPEEPPPRSLADFIPDEPLQSTAAGEQGEQGETVKCPFCEGFEGDEMAVTYHIDREHLT